jgi:hypothetical protein
MKARHNNKKAVPIERQSVPAKPRLLLWLLPVFIAGLISRFWMIERLAMTVPNNDQWHVTVLGIMQPWIHGTFDWKFLFSPWQEHRLITTKLYDLATFLLLGRFDNPAQCRITAVIFCVVVCGFTWLLTRRVPNLRWPLLGVCLVILVLPFGLDNTVNGFQAQTYWCVFATTASAWLFASGRFWLGSLVSVLGITTLASGFVAAPAFAVIIVMDYLRARLTRVRLLTLMLRLSVILGVCILGVTLRGSAPQQAVHHAHSIGQFLVAFSRYLAWPCLLIPWAVIAVTVPCVWLMWQRWNGKTQNTFCERLSVLLFLIFLLQAALTAVLRANMVTPMVTRYQDEFAPALLAGLLALHELRGKLCHQTVAGAWACATFIGLGSLTQFALGDSFYWADVSNHNLIAASQVIYLSLNHGQKPDVPARFWPAGNVAENGPMPELPGLMTDPDLMQKMPPFWNLDHPVKGPALLASKSLP